MRGVNKIILIGKPISYIRLAINRVVNGQEQDQFHSVVRWDSLAETTGTYVKKGDPIYVDRRLECRSFQMRRQGARRVLDRGQ